MEAIRADKRSYIIFKSGIIQGHSDIEPEHPEIWGYSTSGSYPLIGEFPTPTNEVEQNLERKLDEKHNLFIQYFTQELDLVRNRLDKYQKTLGVQSKELNAMKKEMNLQKLDRIAAYEDNWNGEGSYKFDEDIIKNAKSIIFSSSLLRQPKVFPTNRNTIQLEYEESNNNYMEVEIFQDKFSLYKEKIDEESENTVHSIDEIIKAMNEF